MAESSKSDKVAWVTKSPFHLLPEVTLLRDRWDNHVVRGVGGTGHSEMAGLEINAQIAVSTPTAVVNGNPGTGNVIFVNHEDKTSKGHPITVIVSTATARVVTALYDRRFVIVKEEDKLWPS